MILKKSKEMKKLNPSSLDYNNVARVKKKKKSLIINNLFTYLVNIYNKTSAYY